MSVNENRNKSCRERVGGYKKRGVALTFLMNSFGLNLGLPSSIPSPPPFYRHQTEGQKLLFLWLHPESATDLSP